MAVADSTVIDLDSKVVAETLLASLAEAKLAASGSDLDVAQAIAVAIRAAHVLGVEQLGAISESFPASIRALLTVPEPTIDVSRDAALEVQDSCAFIDLFDLLCDEDLPCLAPRLHRGWQDKTQSCRDARRLTASVVGFSIDGEFRHSLLGAVAITNRVFMVAPPVRLDHAQSRRSLAAVLRLIDLLSESDEGGGSKRLVAQLRSQMDG